MSLLYCILACISGAVGLTITNPAPGSLINASKEVNLTWISEASDPRSISIDIVTSEGARDDVVYTIVQDYDTSTEQYETVWPSSILTSSRSYRLFVSDSQNQNVITQSGTFGLTSQQQTKRQIVGTPPDPSEEIARDFDPGSDGQESLVVETVVPSVVVIAVVCFGVNVWFRGFRNRRRCRKSGVDIEGKTPSDMEEGRLVNMHDSMRGLGIENAIPNSSGSGLRRPKLSRKSHVKWDLSKKPPMGYSNLDNGPTGMPLVKLFSSSRSDSPEASASSSPSMSRSHHKSPSTTDSSRSSQYSQATNSPNPLRRVPQAHVHNTSSRTFTREPPAYFPNTDSHTVIGASTITPATGSLRPPSRRSLDSEIMATPLSAYYGHESVDVETDSDSHYPESHYPSRSQTQSEADFDSPVSDMSLLTSRNTTRPTSLAGRSRLSAVVHELIQQELSRVSLR